MQRSFKLATQAGEPSLDYWGVCRSHGNGSYRGRTLHTHIMPLWKCLYQAMKA
jgi:hypothetical protein